MATPLFQRLTHYEDDVEYFVNGKSVAHVNHDEHGWAGMEAVDELITNIARELGTEVEDADEVMERGET